MKKAWAFLLILLPQLVSAGNEPVAWTDPQTSMPFVQVPKGCFRMGNKKAPIRPGHITWIQLKYEGQIADDESPAHEVCVDAFWLGRYEITRAQWQSVMGTKDPAESGRHPVSNISWLEAQEFLRRLNLAAKESRYRLPTEAEWEYACLAGSKNASVGDPELLKIRARFDAGSGGTVEVGQLAPNAFGLSDMLGNVWEWVEDSYVKTGYSQHALYNPKVSQPSTPRVMRGASFMSEDSQVRCATRGRYPEAERLSVIGLRVVREAKE